MEAALRAFRESEPITFTATVLSVDKDARTCEVEDADGLDYTARLSSAISEGDRVISHPVIKSSVLVSMIGDDIQTLYVSSVSEVESIEGTIGKTEFKIDKDGYKIDRDGENLNEVLTDLLEQFGKLCDELNKVVVSVGVTPNVPAITAIKNTAVTTIGQRLNKILE